MGLKEQFGLLSDKECLLKISDAEQGYLHQSWMIGDEVIIYENIPCNYPAAYLSVSSTIEEYFDSIREVDWINDRNNILINEINVEDHGTTFPFTQYLKLN